MFFVAALVISLIIKFRFPKGKSVARIKRKKVMFGIQLLRGSTDTAAELLLFKYKKINDNSITLQLHKCL